MEHTLLIRLEKLFELTTDLAISLDESQYKAHMPNLPSNSIGEQLCCIVGARESYLAQLHIGGTFTYTCSVVDPYNKFKIMKALYDSTVKILSYRKKDALEKREIDILLAILEHEAQHHGQLIRYVYGNKWSFPNTWHTHYTV